ncbi:MAG: ABC transporter permease [Cyclobacteriaceae bacterium]|nr:ABC transporter permease [Cyclobacteriaceae bacterium]
MLLSYLKIALRNIQRYLSFSVINIFGLTLGLTAFLAISLYILDELSFDRHHAHKDRIYRAVIQADFDGQTNKWGGAPNLLGPTAMQEIPEVEKASRYFHHNFGDIAFLSNGVEDFSETQLFFADPELFKIFTFQFIKGNPESALTRPGTVVLSERAAQKYFAESDPIGKTLTIDNTQSLEVTGVYQDFPSNSFLQANLIASFSSHWFGEARNQSWGNASFDTFFLLYNDATKLAVDQKIDDMLRKHLVEEDRWFSISLQPLLDIRLKSGDLNATYDRRAYGDLSQIKILSALALLILLIAAVNYMNLTTAQSQRRNKEVGVAKTLGATYRQLNTKFYFEASLFVLISMLLSLVAFTIFLPVFNSISGKTISLSFTSSVEFWVFFGLIWFVLTLVSGSYPAWYLSSFSPKSALQKTSNSNSQVFIRKSLVVLQFSISIILMITTVMFYRQMDYIQNKKLGYEPEQVIAIMTTAAKDRTQVPALKADIESMTNVTAVARTQSFPGIGTSMRNIVREGSEGDGAPLLTTRATHEILEVLNIKLLAGKTLPEIKDPNDTTVQVLLNKAAVDYLGLTPEEAVGKRVNIQGFQGSSEVVGVTEDFHFTSLHQKIGAFCFHNATRTESFNYLLIKASSNDLPTTLASLEEKFKKTISASFEYTFLDQHLAGLYKSEQNLARVVLLFSALAIFIACLGLYALAAFTTEQRTKEIGIRKVMGASVPQLISLLSKDFLKLVVVAIAVSIPVGYYLMSEWLEGFAYKTSIGISVFILAGSLSLLIAWITVSFESVKASLSNPVNSLRNE